MYGSTIKGNLKPESDIDILIILKKHDKTLENRILNKAAQVSSKLNKTISITTLDEKELKREKNTQFIRSVKSNMEIIYGKNSF